MLTAVTRSEASSILADGGVLVDGHEVTKGSIKVREGQRVRIVLPDVPEGPLVAPDASIDLRVVHEDDDVVVIDKPAGLVVHPGAGNLDGTLVNALVARYPEIVDVGEPERPGIVHRIDKGTSGLLAVARTPRAYDALVAALSAHDVEREYLALVWGRPEATHGVVDAAIGRSGRDPTRMAVSNRGRHARTHYEVVRTFDNPVPLALVRCRLETGRTHQIRVHMAAIGHPVVGDDRYGGARSPVPVDRPFLHAARLSFAHPVTGEPVEATSPLPADLEAVLGTLG
ncbi:RluA family pseudouridine synthase [Actinomarinicola tropica]|uniref:Pseudouridine synthase n=2 Tax=Actinomarinicola tropica TaxID=2789776 RepID=A0A5Q2RR88_9ACTN|nr:RluA family pseudouridine synthase [Actinomarinicola tropica]